MRQVFPLVVGFVLVALVGCASTGITDSWVAPDAGRIAFKKTLVMVVHPVDAIRLEGENRLVRRIGYGRAVASHTLISQEDVQDTDAARAAIEGAGFDGVVLMRVVGQDQKLSYQRGMTYPAEYGQFWGFYGTITPMIYGGGGMQSERTVSVETNVYSLADEKLLWSGVSDAVNPFDLGAAVEAIADAVSRELRREGLLD